MSYDKLGWWKGKIILAVPKLNHMVRAYSTVVVLVDWVIAIYSLKEKLKIFLKILSSEENVNNSVNCQDMIKNLCLLHGYKTPYLKGVIQNILVFF